MCQSEISRLPCSSFLQPDLLENIGSMLSKAGLHEKAGDFFEHLGQLERARDSYRAGGTYRKAVDLARRAFPGQVCASFLSNPRLWFLNSRLLWFFVGLFEYKKLIQSVEW